jgi:hypothetical protein
MTNLNTLAREITLDEGLKKSLSIAQVKEVIRLFMHYLKYMEMREIADLLKKAK